MKAKQFIHSFAPQKEQDNHLYETVDDRVGDLYDATHLTQDKTLTKLVIYFNKIPPGFRKGAKYWAEDEMLLKNSSPASTRGNILILHNAISYLQEHYNINALEDLQEQQFDSYMMYLKDRVKTQGSLELKSAYSYAISFVGFLAFLQDEEIVSFPYLFKKNPAKLFPYDKPEKFFTGNALKEHLSKKKRYKEERPLNYMHLAQILKDIPNYNDTLFCNITTIMAHTGLRLTEVLHLKSNCLEDASEEEKRNAESNRIPIDNKEELYWLSNYKTIKTKQKKWIQGTPILVGSEVKKAVDSLTAHSKDLLHKNKRKTGENSSYICLAYHRGTAKILTTSGYRSKAKRFASATGIKPFTAHQFRHTYASMLYDSGIPIEFIRKYLNHIHEDMTEGYIKKDRQKTLQKYEYFTTSKVFSGGGAQKAYALQKKVKEAYEHPEFSAMVIEDKIQLLEMLSDSQGVDIYDVGHGKCLLPKGTRCPNDFIEINSCYEQNCSSFAPSENSIPHFTRLVERRKNDLKDYEATGHFAAAKRMEKRLAKNIETLECLKKGEYFGK